MNLSQDPQTRSLGAFAYENWRIALDGGPALDTLEYPLFSDSNVLGQITSRLGPYEVLNCVADPEIDPHRPVLVLRISYHARWQYGALERTDTSRYHGGAPTDEIAALLSLSVGIRLRAGGATRYFKPDGDPRGMPWSFRERGNADPVVTRSSWGAVLPDFAGDHHLQLTPRLERFHELQPIDSVALLRAARLYQDAVWIAESETNLAWLMLVSAVEAAAVHWRRGLETPIERLQASRPQLVELLRAHGGEELVAGVARELSDTLGVTKKFIEFCMTFLPSPPTGRPAEPAQIPWTDRDLRKAFRQIYSYRSKALHEGVPFPGPMCVPPSLYGDPRAERLGHGGAGTHGGIWVNSDLPMFFHMFEYIARNALVAWWDSMLSVGTDGSKVTQ